MSFYPSLIDGKDVALSEPIDVLDPSTGKASASVAAGTAAYVHDAVAAATAAAGQWASTTLAGVELTFHDVKKSRHEPQKGLEGLSGYAQLKSVVVGIAS